MKPSFLLPGTRIQGRYEIEGIISSGSFGIVYLALDHETQEEVALKTLNAQASAIPEHVGRFTREGRLGRKLSHPNIVEHLDFGHIDDAEGGGLFLILELIRGLPLGDIIDTRGPLNLDEAVHVLTQVLEALHCVHCSEAIHRDLKPDNILLAAPESARVELDPVGSIAARVGVPDADTPSWQDLTRSKATLLDFGLGKFIPSSDHDFTKITTTGMAAGTLYYMSPEQIEAEKDLDYRSDIYASAMLLFRMLNGDPPYCGQMMVQLATSHLKAPPPKLPQGLDLHPINAVYERAASKRPENRFESAAAMAWALRASLDPELAKGPAPHFEPPHQPTSGQRGFWKRLFGK